MANKVTVDELCKKLDKVPQEVAPATAKAMNTCCLNSEAQAKANCWPGTSPYWKAPHRTGTMRRAITSRVDIKYAGGGTVSIRGIIGIQAAAIIGGVQKVFYPLFVHEGTSKMKARPFLLDAALSTREQNMELLKKALQNAIRKVAKP